MREHNIMHFVLTKEYIAAANTGHPFSQDGLDSICAIFRSPKRHSGEDFRRPFMSRSEALVRLGNIRNERLDAYRSCRGDIEEHAEGERELGQNYYDRILLELMQNADDATNTEQIGYKGVGFKAVLNITDSPRIYSDPLFCKFDSKASHNLLSRALTEQDGAFGIGQKAPVLRLPFRANPEEEPSRVQQLIREYDTVIVLPFRDEKTYERFAAEWIECCNDSRILLFLHRLEKVIWERDEVVDKTWHCRRSGSKLQLWSDPSNEKIHRSWEINREGQSAVVTPIDKDENPQPVSDYPNIRVFFPTKESSPLPLLMHAPFPVDLGRNHICFDDENNEADHALNELATCIRNLLMKTRCPGLFLDLEQFNVDMRDIIFYN